MNISLLKNDKSTFWDEVVLGIISIGCLALGIILVICRPSIWIIESNSIVVMGAMIAIFGFMFLPCLIYRLCTNDKSDKKSEV